MENTQVSSIWSGKCPTSIRRGCHRSESGNDAVERAMRLDRHVVDQMMDVVDDVNVGDDDRPSSKDGVVANEG